MWKNDCKVNACWAKKQIKHKKNTFYYLFSFFFFNFATSTFLIMTENMLFITLGPSSMVILLWIAGGLIFLALIGMIYRQVAQRKLLEKDLLEIEKMLQTNVEYEFVLKAMRLATWHLDPKMRSVTFDNDFRENNDNYAPQAGTNIDDWIMQMIPVDQARVKKALDDICQGLTDIFYQQYQVKSVHQGKTYWEESYATIVERDAEGTPTKVVGASMRIDGRKEMESALILARNKAEESDRLKTAFIANMGHEIRTPLNAIVGFADLLPMVQDEDDRNNIINEIRLNNQKLLRIVEGLVSMAEIEAGAHSLALAAVDLNSLFMEIAQFYQPSTNVSILTHLPQDELLVHTDQTVLREIVDNLMQNAIKFTFEGTITLGYDIEGDQVRIWVSDTGMGIAEKDQDRIFERFVKLDEYIPGTGLGLSVVKSHAANLGGTTGVESTLGKGSRFWVLLPIV
jgi:signal transduction histidine kinase